MLALYLGLGVFLTKTLAQLAGQSFYTDLIVMTVRLSTSNRLITAYFGIVATFFGTFIEYFCVIFYPTLEKLNGN